MFWTILSASPTPSGHHADGKAACDQVEPFLEGPALVMGAMPQTVDPEILVRLRPNPHALQEVVVLAFGHPGRWDAAVVLILVDALKFEFQ